MENNFLTYFKIHESIIYSWKAACSLQGASMKPALLQSQIEDLLLLLKGLSQRLMLQTI